MKGLLLMKIELRVRDLRGWRDSVARRRESKLLMIVEGRSFVMRQFHRSKTMAGLCYRAIARVVLWDGGEVLRSMPTSDGWRRAGSAIDFRRVVMQLARRSRT
jgi:hypothetical protein